MFKQSVQILRGPKKKKREENQVVKKKLREALRKMLLKYYSIFRLQPVPTLSLPAAKDLFFNHSNWKMAPLG